MKRNPTYKMLIKGLLTHFLRYDNITLTYSTNAIILNPVVEYTISTKGFENPLIL